MSKVLYKGVEVPVFESYVGFGDYMYGLMQEENNRGYYLYQLDSKSMKIAGHIVCKEGITMELAVMKSEGLCICCKDSDGDMISFISWENLKEYYKSNTN